MLKRILAIMLVVLIVLSMTFCVLGATPTPVPGNNIPDGFIEKAADFVNQYYYQRTADITAKGFKEQGLSDEQALDATLSVLNSGNMMFFTRPVDELQAVAEHFYNMNKEKFNKWLSYLGFDNDGQLGGGGSSRGGGGGFKDENGVLMPENPFDLEILEIDEVVRSLETGYREKLTDKRSVEGDWLVMTPSQYRIFYESRHTNHINSYFQIVDRFKLSPEFCYVYHFSLSYHNDYQRDYIVAGPYHYIELTNRSDLEFGDLKQSTVVYTPRFGNQNGIGDYYVVTDLMQNLTLYNTTAADKGSYWVPPVFDNVVKVKLIPEIYGDINLNFYDYIVNHYDDYSNQTTFYYDQTVDPYVDTGDVYNNTYVYNVITHNYIYPPPYFVNSTSPPSDQPTVPPSGGGSDRDYSGFFGTIIRKLDEIKEAILGLPQKIADKINTNMFGPGYDVSEGGFSDWIQNNIFDKLGEFLKGLFLPAEGFLEEKFNGYKAKLSEKMPFIFGAPAEPVVTPFNLDGEGFTVMSHPPDTGGGAVETLGGIIDEIGEVASSEEPPQITVKAYGVEVEMFEFSMFDPYMPIVHGIILFFAYIAFIRRLYKDAVALMANR